MKLDFYLQAWVCKHLNSHVLVVSLISDEGKQWIKEILKQKAVWCCTYSEATSCSNFIWFPHIKEHIQICTVIFLLEFVLTEQGKMLRLTCLFKGKSLLNTFVWVKHVDWVETGRVSFSGLGADVILWLRFLSFYHFTMWSTTGKRLAMDNVGSTAGIINVLFQKLLFYTILLNAE